MQDLSVLIVDDMRSMRSIVKRVLQEMGFKKLFEAEDGSEALSVLRSKKIDLVISDVEMPKMDGIELLDEVDKDEDLKDIPFIMLTAMNNREKVIEILEHKVTDFVLKPINPQMLEQRVQAFLNNNPQEIPDLDA
jgi:two-component system, chemotaxis family, chemotaxis protein CheY